MLKTIFLIFLFHFIYSKSLTPNVYYQSSSDEEDHCSCSANFPKSRVYNGQPVIGFDYFWVVALYSKSFDSVLCTGSLLSESTVLIAAHCVDEEDVNDLYVLAGFVYNWRLMKDTSWGYKKVSKMIQHPSYDTKNRVYPVINDIAILELQEKFVLGFNNSISLACILNRELVRPENYDYYFAGYGLVHPFLLYRNQSHTPYFEAKGLNHIKLNYDLPSCSISTMSEVFFCTKNDEGSLCNIDSGGGLHVFIDNKLTLVSIQSSIIAKKIHKNKVSYRCRNGTISLSIKISPFLDFIKNEGKAKCLID